MAKLHGLAQRFHQRAAAAALMESPREATWVWRQRRVMPPEVPRLYRMPWN